MTLVVIKENGNCKFNREEDVTVVAIPVIAEVAAAPQGLQYGR